MGGEGRGNVYEEQNYTPVEGMEAQWRQFDKVQQLELSASTNSQLRLSCVFVCINIYYVVIIIHLQNPPLIVAHLKVY